MLRNEFLERTAFKEMTFNGAAPNLGNRDGNAAKNVIAIFDEIMALLPGSVGRTRETAAA